MRRSRERRRPVRDRRVVGMERQPHAGLLGGGNHRFQKIRDVVPHPVLRKRRRDGRRRLFQVLVVVEADVGRLSPPLRRRRAQQLRVEQLEVVGQYRNPGGAHAVRGVQEPGDLLVPARHPSLDLVEAARREDGPQIHAVRRDCRLRLAEERGGRIRGGQVDRAVLARPVGDIHGHAVHAQRLQQPQSSVDIAVPARLVLYQHRAPPIRPALPSFRHSAASSPPPLISHPLLSRLIL